MIGINDIFLARAVKISCKNPLQNCYSKHNECILIHLKIGISTPFILYNILI